MVGSIIDGDVIAVRQKDFQNYVEVVNQHTYVVTRDKHLPIDILNPKLLAVAVVL